MPLRTRQRGQSMVDFGVIACRELVPDVWDLADGFAEAVHLLKKAADDATGATPPGAETTASEN